MQPLLDLTIVRPWHWGISIVGPPNAQIPDIDTSTQVSVGPASIVMLVRHAQDVEFDVFEGDWDWATPTIRLRSLREPDPTDRIVVGEAIFDTPDERISIGDADGEIVVPAPALRTRVVVSTRGAVSTTSMDEVWIDLSPASDV